MVKNDIWLGGASKQNVPFLENICHKKCTHAPNVQNRPWMFHGSNRFWGSSYTLMETMKSLP